MIGISYYDDFGVDGGSKRISQRGINADRCDVVINTAVLYVELTLSTNTHQVEEFQRDPVPKRSACANKHAV